MISINATLVIQIIHFLILVFILNRLMFRPIVRIIDERSRFIEDTKIKVTGIGEETAELTQRCISMEMAVRKEAGEESSRLKNEAMNTAERIFSDTKTEITTIKDRVGKEVEEKLKTARQSLQHEAVVLADAIADKVIGRRIGN